MWLSTTRNRWRPGRPAGLLVVVVAAIAAMGCVTVEAGEGGFVMGGTIHVPEGETTRDDVVAVGGNVRIDGRATRDVVVIGGQLIINGVVEGSVSCVGGTLILGPGARVERDAVVVGGFLRRHDTARIGGEFVNVSIAYPGGQVLGGPRFGPMGWGWWGFTPFAWVWRTTQLFYWLLLALLTVALVGDRVSSASHAISREPLRLGAIGLVGVFALCFAFVVLLVLSFLIIGIPFLIALIVTWWLAYIFGIVAVFQSVGSRVMNLAGRPDASQIGIVLAGALVMGIFRYIPFGLGGLLWVIAAFVGLGSVFATRFGTGRSWVRPSGPPPPMPASPPPSDPYAAPASQPVTAADAMEFDQPDAGQEYDADSGQDTAEADDEEGSRGS